MRSGKRFCLFMLTVALLTPFALMLLNGSVISRLYELPHGIRDADRPFYAFMYLNSDYRAQSFEYNLYSGVTRKRYTTGGDGLRVPIVRPGTDLVVISGDSTIFGLGLDDEQTVPFVLQDLLGPGVSVVNAGVPGKALVHNLLTLKDSIRLADARGVRVRTFVNWLNPGDFTLEYRDAEAIVRQATRQGLTFRESLAARFPTLHHIYWRLRRPGNITGPIRQAALHMVRGTQRCPIAHPVPEPVSDQQKAYLQQMLALCAERSIALVHVVHGRSADDPFIAHTQRFLLENGAENVFTVLALYPPGEPLTDDHFGHFNARAALALARGLEGALRRVPDPN